MKQFIHSACITAILLLTACGGDRQPSAPGQKTTATLPDGCPDRFTAVLATTKGEIRIDVTKADAPLGAQRFYDLVKSGYYTDVAFFRVIPGFMAQAGIHGDPTVNAKWRGNRIADDPVRGSNVRGTVSFAMGGPGTRTTQFFINLADNPRLDGMGFAPFGRVADMTTVDGLYGGYGEGAPSGQGPNQMMLQTRGNAWLKPAFPRLDYILSAAIAP